MLVHCKIFGYPAPLPNKGAECCSECVCLDVSVSEHMSGTTYPICTKFLMHVTYGRGVAWYSLFWRYFDTLCTSSFTGMSSPSFGL